jgi:stearoyl-CoA desaturase (delta-9 desaturase)
MIGGPTHILGAGTPQNGSFIFYRLGLVSQPRTANEADLKEATEYMRLRATPGGAPTEQDVPWTGNTWDITQAIEYVASRAGCCLIIIDEYLVDVTVCLGEHVRPHEMNP